jgi:hypothetical protein
MRLAGQIFQITGLEPSSEPRHLAFFHQECHQELFRSDRSGINFAGPILIYLHKITDLGIVLELEVGPNAVSLPLWTRPIQTE